jgi:hypothetical protein
MFQWQWGKSVFPEGLRLNNLQGIIISYYTKDDKKALFSVSYLRNSTINAMISTVEMAIINIFQGRNTFVRESVDKMCPGCGKYEHSVFHNRYDFCANYLLASKFFMKYPKVSTKVLGKYKEHQLRQQKAIKDKNKPDKCDNTVK